MADPPDEIRSIELIRGAQAGDQAALNRLFARYYDRVRRIVRLRLGNRLREHLESADVLQGTFVAAVEDFERFEARDESSLIHWLAKLAEREILDAARYHGAQKRDAGRAVALEAIRAACASGELRIEPSAPTDLPLGKLEDEEERELVESAIRSLPDEMRELVVLRHYVGASWADVVRELGHRTERAARVAHGKAMLALGARLRELRPDRD